LTIPYVPRWTFGEDLAALIEPRNADGVRTSGAPISYTLETIAAVLANNFNKIELLSVNRDEYVLTARAIAQTRNVEKGGPKKVFLSYPREYLYIAREIYSVLFAANFAIMDTSLPASETLASQIMRQVEQADAMIVVVGPLDSQSTYRNEAVEWFLRQSLRSNVHKPLIPVILPGAEQALQNSRLSDLVGLRIDPNKPLDRQFVPLIRRLSFGEGEALLQASHDVSLPKVYLIYRPEDEQSIHAVADALLARDVELLLPAFEGDDAALNALHRELLKISDAVVLYWGSASEVWVKAILQQLRNWSDLGRTHRFSFIGLIAGPPIRSRKLQYIKLKPRNETDLTLDLTWADEVTPKLLAPLTSMLPLTPNSIP
jgi:hypothetical protein